MLYWHQILLSYCIRVPTHFKMQNSKNFYWISRKIFHVNCEFLRHDSPPPHTYSICQGTRECSGVLPRAGHLIFTSGLATQCGPPQSWPPKSRPPESRPPQNRSPKSYQLVPQRPEWTMPSRTPTVGSGMTYSWEAYSGAGCSGWDTLGMWADRHVLLDLLN